MVALEADRCDAVLHREAFRIDLPFFAVSPSSRIGNRGHAEVLNSGRALIGVAYNAAEKPEAGIGHADKIAARAHEAEGGKRAETGRVRCQFKAADEFQRPELRFVATDMELSDRAGADLDMVERGRAGVERP